MKSYLILMTSAVVFLGSCEQKDATSSAASEAAGDAVKVTEVVMENMEFSPARVEISVGEAVYWVNTDIVAHTVTSAEFGDSGLLEAKEDWSHTFEEAGEFSYVCTLHPTMTGTVVVK